METARLVGLVTMTLLIVVHPPATAQSPTSAREDVFVSLETGLVQWRTSAGALRAVLVGVVSGPASGMRFDAAGNLYVAHRCADGACTAGNTVEKFTPRGVSQGAVGGPYHCDPHSIAFDAAGGAFVAQAHCTTHVLKFTSGQPPTSYPVQSETRGALWIDLAGDGCTLFYTSRGPDVKRFDVCANRQLRSFNLAPMPGGETRGIRILPDGGALVSSGAVVARLDADGALVRSYGVASGEPQDWAGLDLGANGTFWAINSATSSVFQFDLATGEVRGSVYTGTAANTAVDVAVRRVKTPPAPVGGLILR